MNENEIYDSPNSRKERYLSALPSDQPLLTRVRPGTKKGVGSDFLLPENLLDPIEARLWHGNLGFRLGLETDDGWSLIVFDVEEAGVLPRDISDNLDSMALVVWTSLHGGRNRLLRVTQEAKDILRSIPDKIDLDGDGIHELEILTSNHALAPGSIVEHRHCRPSKPCDGTDEDIYEFVKASPEAPINGVGELDEILTGLEIEPSKGSKVANYAAAIGELPHVDDKLVEAGEARIREFQNSATTQAFRDIMDVLQGGTGNLDLPRHDNGTIDRDQADLEGVWLVYGVMRNTGASPERARKLTYAVFTQYCVKFPYMKTGRPRKWIDEREGDDYRLNRLNRAIAAYEQDHRKWLRWKRRENPTSSEGSDIPMGFSGEYSDITIDAVWISVSALAISEGNISVKAVVKLLADQRDFALPDNFTIPPHPSGHKVHTPPDPRGGEYRETERWYPTTKDVVDLTQEIHPDRSPSTHETVLKDLQRKYKQVKMAFCPARPSGTRYVYYPDHLPDPSDADSVKIGGHEQEPEIV